MTSRTRSNDRALGLGIRPGLVELDVFVMSNMSLSFCLNASGQKRREKLLCDGGCQYPVRFEGYLNC